MTKPDISIIVRTKNEERWIGHCLTMLFQQDRSDFEVILVDNRSTDDTIRVAKRHPVARILTIDQFLPGRALNDGIRASHGKYIVCLSAHCIPKNADWLSSLRRNFDGDDTVAGVYGRQLPLSFTDDVDKRDLLIVFGQDRRVQVKDYFFHNANSMLRRDVWDRFPFDEEVTNIEDRVWGKQVITAGYRLVYDPDAAVYHHHGLHQGNTPQRARGVVSIIERIEEEVVSDLPASLRPESANIAAVIPVRERPAAGSEEHRLLTSSVAALKAARYVNSAYVLAPDAATASAAGGIWLNRNAIPNVNSLAVDELLRGALELIEGREDYPEALLYVNYDYLHRPEGLFDELIRDAQYKGYDTAFAGYVDFGHYWVRNGSGEYLQTDASLRARTEREPAFRALYGLGCVTSASIIRTGKLVGGKVGILPIADFKHTIRLRDAASAAASAVKR